MDNLDAMCRTSLQLRDVQTIIGQSITNGGPAAIKQENRVHFLCPIAEHVHVKYSISSEKSVKNSTGEKSKKVPASHQHSTGQNRVLNSIIVDDLSICSRPPSVKKHADLSKSSSSEPRDAEHK